MKMTLDNFRDFVPSRIWRRGMDYYNEGAVLSLEEEEPGEWRAVVEGSDDYSVGVTLDGDGILEWECDCPYDGGDICKHVVAVVIALQHGELDAFRQASRNDCSTGRWNALKNENIARSLIDFYKRKNEEYVKAQADYVGRVTEIFHDAVVASRRFSRSYSGPELNWENVCLRMDALFDEVEGLQECGDFQPSVDAAMTFFEEVDANADDGLMYDSYCDLGDTCDRAGDLILTALRSGKIENGEKLLSGLRSLVKKAAYDEYSVYDITELLEQANLVLMSPDEALICLDDIIERHKDSFRLWQYVFQKIDLLKECGRDEEAGQVIEKYLYLNDVRKRRLEELLAEERFEDALTLLDDGIASADKSLFSGNADMWRERKLEIYERLNDIPTAIGVCRQLFINKYGNMDCYRKLKALVAPSEWKVFLADMLGNTRMSSCGGHNTIADIYVEEKDFDSLFALLSQQAYDRLALLNNYACHFPDSYSSGLIRLFAETVRQYAEANVSRNHYVVVADTLRRMRRFSGGSEAASALAEEFRHTYKRRPAMMDELKGV